MLDTSPANLRREIEAAVKFRKKHTDLSAEMIDQYATSHHMEGRGPEVKAHENHSFDHCINTVPALVFYNPKTRIKSRRPKVHRQIARSMTHGMNRWIHDVQLSDTLTEIALDLQFDFGVALVTLDPLPGYEDVVAPPLRPTVTRISPRRFFQDPQANSERGVRFQGHESIRDFEDLWNETYTDENGKIRYVYNRQVLQRLTPDVGVQTFQKRDPVMDMPGESEKVPRHQIRFFETYVPEEGKVYTLACDAQADDQGYLRTPREYVGPPTGPYVLFGIYAVPDQVYPLAPLTVTADLVNELNSHLDQVVDAADQARTFTICNGTNTKLVEAIDSGRHGETLAVPGFDGSQAMTVTIGGPAPETLNYIDRLRMRLDRRSGIPDFERGNVTGEATATENQLASAAGDFRRKFMQAQFRKRVRRLLETVAWYMAESSNVVFPIPMPRDEQFGEDGADEGGLFGGGGDEQLEDGLFLGGRQPGEDFDFNDLEIEIEPMSMELVDENLLQRRLTEFYTWLTREVAPGMLNFPFLRWAEMIDDFAESRNIPDGRKYVNWSLLEMLAGQQLSQYDNPQDTQGLEGSKMPSPKGAAPGAGLKLSNQEEERLGGSPLPMAGNEMGAQLGAAVAA